MFNNRKEIKIEFGYSELHIGDVCNIEVSEFKGGFPVEVRHEKVRVIGISFNPVTRKNALVCQQTLDGDSEIHITFDNINRVSYR